MLLLRYQRHIVAPDVEGLIKRLVEEHPLRLGTLTDALAPAGGMADVFGLLANHRLRTDLTLPLDRTSDVRLQKEG